MGKTMRAHVGADHRRSRSRSPKRPRHSSSTLTQSTLPSPPPPSTLPPPRPATNRLSFPSYLETPNLAPKLKILCELIANTPSSAIEKVLADAGIRVTMEDVEEVMKLSYDFPGSAVKFFRWSGYQLGNNHSPYAWNLVVDLLGKNSLFDAMWDAIKSMKKEGLLSLATFASVFSSYVLADKVDEAIMTFEVMNQYGCPRDIIALNSLLSAICRDGKTVNAVEFLGIAKARIRPDKDTYAILLEGMENEGNVVNARLVFDEMVVEIGWDPENVPAYDSFLNILLKGPEGIYEAMQFFEVLRDRGCYPGLKFFKAALQECVKKSDARRAESFWETMVDKVGLRPDTLMYNSMIAIQCYANNIDLARRFLDGMVCTGAFPDTITYNLLFKFLIDNRKLHEASTIFSEMVKNEFVPYLANCDTAVRNYLGDKDPHMAIKVWRCMIHNYSSGLEETGNFLVVELRDLNMLPEAVKYAEDMIDRGIKLSSSTLSKLRQSLAQGRKGSVYDGLLAKWKARKLISGSVSMHCTASRTF